ncbi:hypothetical protein I3843_01G297100 [Carya illinoinensis]|uniref:Uncharacterized protein n=1 Tax=Carya illinoinensis TaxID=32201 RepID=A0A922KD16_CARIL|nr:hypothetical protein I3760_01G303200 [Carya illinoinensis]KAG6735159.1 hypothetical protein I3842_01G307900 [Carya illinoinensis]KAG7999212.1 hypothetical protein I3843_01G297100 [Carya illinoinensis]
MAKPYPTSYRSTPTLTLLIVICLIMISTSPSSSSARLILDMPLNLALPGDINASVDYPLEKEVDDQHHVLPCKSKILFARKYGATMVLNMLPRGPVPPSGPSPRIH